MPGRGTAVLSAWDQEAAGSNLAAPIYFRRNFVVEIKRFMIFMFDGYYPTGGERWIFGMKWQ